jgi:hypothetical protein
VSANAPIDVFKCKIHAKQPTDRHTATHCTAQQMFQV